jgi:catechol 2,3-dioxygenase-like lactoylglutathione lyase family enzyme
LPLSPGVCYGPGMKPRLSVVTLGVRDLDRSLRFYRDGLGLTTDGIVGTEFEGGAVVFIHLAHGLILALWPLHELAKDANVAVADDGPPRFSLGHNVGSRDEVDAVMAQASAAGATIAEAAQDRVWGGYTGYFRDPDGHLWEVVWNPQFPVED